MNTMPSETASRRAGILDAFAYTADLLATDEDCVLLLDGYKNVLCVYPVIEEFMGMQFDWETFERAGGLVYHQTCAVKMDPENAKNLLLVMVSLSLIEDSQRERLKRWGNGMSRFLLRFCRYEDIIDGLNAIDEGMNMIDRNGIVIFANKSCYDITESGPEDMMNYPLEKNIREQPVLISVLADGKTRIDFEYYLTFKNRMIHLINSAYPIYDENHTIKGAVDVFRNIKRSRKLADDLAGYHAIYTFENLIGDNEKLKKVIRDAMAFANSDKSILIQGESGVGKELFAQSIHNYSFRNEAPFVALNCANLPSELIDSELFGYEDGAFTGAKKQGKQGKFEMAKGGTVFLDEIGELPIQLQAKLLRVLETKEISRIGSNKKIRVDIRVIAATNQDLDQMVHDGRFRADLLYRLRVLYIVIPPLRERKSDIALLTEYFLDKISYDLNLSRKRLTPSALELLNRYSWPGNIREFENVMYRAAYLTPGDVIDAPVLSQCGVGKVGKIAERTQGIDEVTRDHFIRVLEQNKGNKKLTSEQLGISRPTVYRLIRKFNIKM